MDLKESIKIINKFLKTKFLYGKMALTHEQLKDIQDAIEVILNLIEKLQKENEQINNRDIKRLAEIGELRTENSYLKQENEYLNCICESDKDNYINKGKIREKIRYLEDEGYFEFNTKRDLEKAIKMFKELLEEE